VYRDCITLYPLLRGFVEAEKRDYQQANGKEKHGTLQYWTTGMWCFLWNIWKNGIETEITDELSFSWPTTAISEWEKKNLYHDSGITSAMKGDYYYKGDFMRQPETLDVSGYKTGVCSNKYTEYALKVIEQANENKPKKAIAEAIAVETVPVLTETNVPALETIAELEAVAGQGIEEVGGIEQRYRLLSGLDVGQPLLLQLRNEKEEETTTEIIPEPIVRLEEEVKKLIDTVRNTLTQVTAKMEQSIQNGTAVDREEKWKNWEGITDDVDYPYTTRTPQVTPKGRWVTNGNWDWFEPDTEDVKADLARFVDAYNKFKPDTEAVEVEEDKAEETPLNTTTTTRAEAKKAVAKAKKTVKAKTTKATKAVKKTAAKEGKSGGKSKKTTKTD
jgi:hypothetical protein